MKRRGWTASRWIEIGFAAALLYAVGCSSSGTSSPPTSVVFACTDSGNAAPDAVTMSCGAATAATTERVDVIIGGPALGSTTMRGMNFDVVYDPAKLEFVPAGSYSSPLFSANALVAVGLAGGQQGRLIVSIQEPGTSSDVAVGTGQHLVLSLTFRTVSAATFSPTPVTFENAEASGASATIAFGSALALSYQ